MNEWLRYAEQMILEHWAQEAVAALVQGRAVQFTVHAVMNQPLKIEVGRHIRDNNWPPVPHVSQR